MVLGIPIVIVKFSGEDLITGAIKKVKKYKKRENWAQNPYHFSYSILMHGWESLPSKQLHAHNWKSKVLEGLQGTDAECCPYD